MRHSTVHSVRRRSGLKAAGARLMRTAAAVLVLFGGALAFGGQAAFASTGSVLADFVPGGATGNGRGIAFDGTNLWYTIVGDPHIFHVTTSGTLLGSILVGPPGASGGPLGWDGSALWTADYSITSTILRVDPSTGIVLSSCDFVAANPGNPAVVTPGTGIGNFPDGLDWSTSASAVWLSAEGGSNPGNWVAELNPTTCAVMASFIAPASGSDGASGLAFVADPFNGDKLWQAHPDVPDIFQTDTAGVVSVPAFGAAHLTEDLAFDPVTFAPKCAVWANEATLGANHLTAYEVPCPEQGITATGTPVSATEGASFSGTVATFTDPDPNSTAGEYAATIDWGDASSSAGTISGPTGGPFTVSGTHTYTQEGSYTVTVTISDVDTPSNTATATSTATVGDAALTATCAAPAVSGQSFSGPVASLSDANTFGSAADFTATIAWGDASSSSGTVSGSGGSYTVSGSHTYASTGPVTITTTITDDGGSTASASCSVLIFGTAAGGNFVIGDGNAAIGTAVTFWGAQWSKLNSLSGGAAPAAFKGFEDAPATVTCGTSWTTDPGNSTPPPAGSLPAFMAVIVSSSITKSGSTISGNTLHMVVVNTNPGYAPNPGHAGTGTVVATIC
jgi:hypothetical protein